MPTVTTPIRLRWLIDDLLTKDGHRLTLGFTCSIAIVDEPAERKLFAEVFGGTGGIPQQSIIEHFLPSLRAAAAEVARGEQAETLLSPSTRPQWTAALRSAANEVGFSCGIEVLAPFDVELTSPTLQRERLEQMQRIAAERRSADRVGHLARAADLLKQWESLKTTIPSITPGKLLEQINPADRGLMLDTLLMAGATNQPDLWAVSGPYLVRVDVKVDSPQPQLIPLPTMLGPLRSVRAANGKLYVGARSGGFVVDPTKPDAATVYRHPTLASEHGFTSVTQIRDRLWACHRIGGLVAWRIGEPHGPELVHTPAQLGGEPKHLIDAGLFSVGSKLLKLSTEQVMDAGSPIVAVLRAENQLVVVAESGSIAVLDGSSFEMTNSLPGNGKLTGATLLPWLSASRLLLNRADGPIECIGLEDQIVTQFTTGHTGMRAAAASAGKVAAMSNDRQRIVLWNAWDGRKITAEVYLTGQTHHRIADLAFG